MPVELAQVAARTFEVTVEEEGEARIREVFTVSATIAGKLHRIDLHAGDEVLAGKTVVASIGPAAPALLDSRSRAVAEATTAAARSAVDLARAQLAQAEATLNFASSEAERARVLHERAALPKRLLDNALLDQRTAEAAVDSARANLSVRERELESAAAVLSGSDDAGPDPCCVTLVAPVSGRVLRVLTESEQVVQPGAPILEIGNPANLEIVVDLLSRDAVRVREGSQARITGWGGDPLPARVARVEPSAFTKVSALGIEEQRVAVILYLQGDHSARRALGHGFRVIVEITLWRGEGILSIPVAALFRDGSDWAAFVVRDGRARLQPITLGERSDEFAQVLGGLSAGDQVILRPSDRIAEGTRVQAITGG
ncbi:efflux RND transporter periplasmic adaptor subunit [Paracoccus benzoatiresistens]|uniref:HlyD family efflux transporter periplasmic adaptor subunit n=1 Tax=Paracoccus benzoatiresistens TaxID=2997341 RepID=A0ABT4JA10_9RHOB|nr:HlyD family efflux transporter periplasmic adaptor subunit [Paracoccus sp. EF6]MCZ0963432.1 HlyD family efflux transporter periplasmic adaptor subunit [Paracoccus sp. EF6]